MAGMSISEVARRFGLRASALRYYERIGILPPPPRTGGRRRYDHTALAQLAVVQSARQAGFSLADLRRLFFGFEKAARPADRWQTPARPRLAELDALAARIEDMKRRLAKTCACETLSECGKRMLAKECDA